MSSWSFTRTFIYDDVGTHVGIHMCVCMYVCMYVCMPNTIWSNLGRLPGCLAYLQEHFRGPEDHINMRMSHSGS